MYKEHLNIRCNAWSEEGTQYFGILFEERYDPGPTLFLTRLAVVNGIKAVSGSMAIFKQLL